MNNEEFSNGAHPIQIMDFETPEDPSQPKVIKLHKDRMDNILQQAGDLRVSIISIAGPSRKGKSFFLGFLIRYLEALEIDESDWMDWENKEKPLTGFKWRGGVDHETSGMLMWSKPFIVKMNNERVAVLLVDTQGTFDQYTTQREWSAIVGLSLLSSSCLIFNSFNDIQEDVLGSLETYIQYGLMALGNEEENMEVDGDAKINPFQKLFFLIRDWGMPTTYPYGSKGGKAYLEKKMKIDDKQPRPVQRVRKTMKQCFDQIDCFLMPHPGDKSMLEGFNGSLSQLSSNFGKKMEELVSDLLNPDDLPLKSIFGNDVFASDITSYFEQYVHIFNGEDMPDPTTLMEATAKISNQNLVNKFKRKYIDSMKKKQRGKSFLAIKKIENAHKAAAKETFEDFRKVKKIGGSDMVKSFEEELIFQIKEEFDKIFSENDKKKSKLIEMANLDAIRSYKNSMMEDFETDESFLDEKRLNSLSRGYVENCITEFKENMKEESEEELEQLVKLVSAKLQDEQDRIGTENKNRKMTAENKMNELVNKISKSYSETMNGYFEDNPFLTKEEMAEHHKDQKVDAENKFNKVNKLGSKDFINSFFKKLEYSLAKEFEEVMKTHQIKLQEAEGKTEVLLNETIDEYKDILSREIESLYEESDFQQKHTALSSDAEISFITKVPYPNLTDLHQASVSKFKETLQSTYETILKEFVQAKKDCEESYRKAVESSLQFYLNEMEAHTKTAEFHSNDELSDKHDKFESEAMEHYNKYPKMGVHLTPDEFPKDLISKIQTQFEKITDSNTEKRELVHEKAKNNVSSCHRDYQSEMLKNLDKARDEDELEDLHQLEKLKVTKQFSDNCPMKDIEFTKPYMEALEQDIDETFEDDIKAVFELKKLERESGTVSALAEARKYYNEEMKKHYNNTEFMRPKDLEALHKRVALQAIDICVQKTPLSEIQKTDLMSEIEKTFEEEYKKVNDMNVPVDPAIGIDLGTTYSCVAVYWKGKVTVIPNAQGKNTTPSYVCYNDKNFVESIGDPAKSKAYENAENTIYDAKRIIGRKFEDEKLQNDMKYWAFEVIEEGKVPKVKINGKSYYPEQISAEVLKEMRVIAEKHLNCEIKNAVITVPAYFNDGQRQATIDAGELAGLKVLNILNEPTAAAVAYKLQHTDDTFRHGLIFDLGGGTFDVAVLKMTKGKIEVLAVDGDTHLGGEDFDQNTMKFCALEFQRQHGIDLMDGKDDLNALVRQDVRKRLKRLQLECERKKIELASCRKVDVCVDGIYNDGTQSIDLKVTLTRDKFEELNEDLFEKTIKIVEKVLKSASIEKSKIGDIILVGGSTRIPKVQDLLVDYFDGKALNKDINPDEAVAYGAAVQAAMMNGQLAQESIDFNKIQDVTPMSLGVEVYGGGFSVIIPKNTKLPAKIKEQYRTAHNNQTSVQITIYQGEDIVAQQNDWLGEFYLNGIPPADAGRETIDVTMEIGLQGVLHVTAVCTSTGDTGSITVTEHKRRMGRETIKRILDEAKPGGA